MTPEQHEAKKAYQRAWFAKRYAEMMADPAKREARNAQKRALRRRNKERAAPAVNQEVYRAHGPFAALFCEQEAA